MLPLLAALPARRPALAGSAGAYPSPPGRPRMGPATEGFLAGIRLALSLADGTSPGSPEAAGAAASARAGFGAGGAPEDFDRIAALVELAQRGDTEAFGLLYERYVDTVYRYVYVRVGSPQTAEDLTAETFVRALRRIDTFSWQGRDIAAWFVTIARNLITDNAKSARFRLEVTTGDMLDADQEVAAPETEVLQRLRDARLIEAVKTLRADQAECLVLRFLQGLSLAETAKILRRSEGAVKQLQLRALRALHRELGGEDL